MLVLTDMNAHSQISNNNYLSQRTLVAWEENLSKLLEF